MPTGAAIAVRRCYVTDQLLVERASQLGVPQSEVLATKIPDPGSTMAGDFGEILVLLLQATLLNPIAAVAPKKWRLKQDRTKPAPHSDVLHFVLPHWPRASAEDVIICSEVKTKSTDGGSTPIASALKDSEKDRTSRLAKTLVWLRERAIGGDQCGVHLKQLNRFIEAVDAPPAERRFNAVAVVCSNLLDGELAAVPPVVPVGHKLLIVSVHDLKCTYEAVFEAVRASVPNTTSENGPSVATKGEAEVL
nr:Hachiman antiphage defense system protein HamA [Myxococcus sp. AM009]